MEWEAILGQKMHLSSARPIADRRTAQNEVKKSRKAKEDEVWNVLRAPLMSISLPLHRTQRTADNSTRALIYSNLWDNTSITSQAKDIRWQNIILVVVYWGRMDFACLSCHLFSFEELVLQKDDSPPEKTISGPLALLADTCECYVCRVYRMEGFEVKNHSKRKLRIRSSWFTLVYPTWSLFWDGKKLQEGLRYRGVACLVGNSQRDGKNSARKAIVLQPWRLSDAHEK